MLGVLWRPSVRGGTCRRSLRSQYVHLCSYLRTGKIRIPDYFYVPIRRGRQLHCVIRDFTVVDEGVRQLRTRKYILHAGGEGEGLGVRGGC